MLLWIPTKGIHNFSRNIIYNQLYCPFQKEDSLKNYVIHLESTFQRYADNENVFQMKRYMKNRFEFFGIPSPLRKEITKPFLLKENLPPISSIKNISSQLWLKPQREFQYFTMELLKKFLKQIEPNFIFHFEYLITTKSWWDTVDFTAANLVGTHLLNHPKLLMPTTREWVESNNMWLQRAAILFQLKYKEKTDTKLLFEYIRMHSNSKEFFIQKAIGWALREYSKTNPKTVVDFVNAHDLSNLSRRKALKRIT